MFAVQNLTKRKAPAGQLNYRKIKEVVLGKKFELSLVFVSVILAKKLNRKFRGKNKPANVLSFPLEKNAGEIFINLDTKKEAKKFGLTHKKYVDFLLIHGALHLKGLDHGKKMEALEQKFLAKN